MIKYNIQDDDSRDNQQIDTSQINFEIIDTDTHHLDQISASVEPIINNLDFAFSRDKSPQYSAIGVKVSNEVTRELILDLDTQKPTQNPELIISNSQENNPKIQQKKKDQLKKKDKWKKIEIQKVKVKKEQKIMNCYKEHYEQISALQFELQELKTILKSAQIDDEITNSQIENIQPNYFVLQQDSQQQLPLEISAPNFSRINRSIERQIKIGNKNTDEMNQNQTYKANGFFDRNDLRTLQLRTPCINHNSQNLIKKKRNSNSDKVKKEKDIISENEEELNLNQSPQHPATNLGISNQNCMSQGEFLTSNPIVIQRTVGERAVSSNATTMFVANNKKPLKINQKSCILMHHYPSQNILAGYNGIEVLKSHRSNISQNRKRNGQLIGRRGATSSNDRQPEYLSKSIQNNIFNQKLLEKTKNTLDNNQYQNIKDNQFESLNNIFIKRSFQNEESQDQLKLKNYFSQQQIEKQQTCNQKPYTDMCPEDLAQTILQQNSSGQVQNQIGIQYLSKTEDEHQYKRQRQRNQSQEIKDEVNINRVQSDILQGIQNNEWANFGQPISIGKLFNVSQMNYNQLGGAITSRSPKDSKIEADQVKFSKQQENQGKSLQTIQETRNLKLEELVPDQITEINKDQSSYISSAVAYQYTRKNGYTSLTHRNLTINGNKKVNLIQNNYFYNNQQIKIQQDRFQQSPTCFSNKINMNGQQNYANNKSNFNQNIVIQAAYEKTQRIQQQLKSYIQILNQNIKKQNMKQKKQIKILKQQPIDFDIESSIDECLSIKQFLSAESNDANLRIQKQIKHQESISCSSICISQEEIEKQPKNTKYKIKENEMKKISNEMNARKKQAQNLKKNQHKQQKGIKFDSDLFPYKINLKNIQKNQNQGNAYSNIEKINFLENSKNNKFSNLSGIEMKCGEYGFLNQEIYGQESHIVLSNNDLIQQESNQTNQAPFMTINNDESDNMLNVARQDARIIISGEEDLTENENFYNPQNIQRNNHSQNQKNNYQEQTENIFFGIRGDQDFNQLSFNNSSSATFLNNSDNQIIDERLSQTDKLNIGHFDINFQKNINTPTRIFSQQQNKEAKLSNQPSGAFFRPVMLSSSRFKNLKEASNSSAMTPSQKKKNIQTLYENLNRLSPVQHKLQSQEGDDIVDHFNQGDKNQTPSQQLIVVSGKDEEEEKYQDNEIKDNQVQLGASRSRTEKSQQIGYYTTLNNQNQDNEIEFQQDENLQIILTQAKSDILDSQINQPPSQINQEESKNKTNIFDEEDKQLLYITKKFENVFQEKQFLEDKVQQKSYKKNQIMQRQVYIENQKYYKRDKNCDRINALINQNQNKIKIIKNSDKHVKIPILNLGKVVDSQCNQEIFMFPEVSTVQASQAPMLGSQGNDGDDICGITVTDDFFANCSVNSPLSKSGQKVICQQSDSNNKIPNQIWNQIINDDLTIGSIGEIGFQNIEYKNNFNQNANKKVIKSFKNEEPNFNENFSIIQSSTNQMQRDECKVSKSLSRLIKLKVSDSKEMANNLINSPLSSIADKSIQFQKSISRSIQKQQINIDPNFHRIFDVKPYNMVDKQIGNKEEYMNDERAENRRSLRQKSHKKQSKSQTYQADIKQQNEQNNKAVNNKVNKLRKKQNMNSKKELQIDNQNIKETEELDLNNQQQKNILRREIEIQYYGQAQQAKTQRPNKNNQNNEYKIPDNIFNDLVQDQQQIYTLDNQNHKNIFKNTNQSSSKEFTKGSVKQTQKVISPLTLQIKKTYIKPKPEQPECAEEVSKQNINSENDNLITMSNKQLSHKTQRLHIKHQRLFGINRNQSSTPRRNMANFGIQINQQNIKLNPQVHLNRNVNPLPLPPYKNIIKNEKEYQNGAFNTIDQTDNVGYYQNQVNILNSARNYDIKNNLNSARISCQSSRKSLGQSTKRSDQKLSARLGQRSTATLIQSNSASRFKQKNNVQKKGNTPRSHINKKLIEIQKTLSDVDEKQNEEQNINCQTIKIESTNLQLAQSDNQKEMFQTVENNIEEQRQNQEIKMKENFELNYKSQSARIIKLPLSKKNRYLQQKQQPTIDNQNIEFTKSIQKQKMVDVQIHENENRMNMQKNDEFKISSINSNNDEIQKSSKIKFDNITSGQTEIKKVIGQKDINRQNLKINQQLIQQKLQGLQKGQKLLNTEVQKMNNNPQINLEGFSDEKNKQFINQLFPQSCKNDIKQSNQLIKFSSKTPKINFDNEDKQIKKLPTLKLQNFENAGIQKNQESAYIKQKKKLQMNCEKTQKNDEFENQEIQNQNEYQLKSLSKEINNEICIFNIKNLSGKKEKQYGKIEQMKLASSYNENHTNYNPSLSISQTSSQKDDLDNLSLKKLQQKIVIKSPSTIFQVQNQKRNLGLNINKSNRAQLSCEGQKQNINIKIKPSQITPSNKINEQYQNQNQQNWQKQFLRIKQDDQSIQQKQEDSQKAYKKDENQNLKKLNQKIFVKIKNDSQNNFVSQNEIPDKNNDHNTDYKMKQQ